MATNGAFPFRFRFVSGAFPESGEIGEHGPGKFEQEPLAKAFGKKHKKTPELYQKASPKCEPRTWSLRIAQDDPRWSNMAQDGSKMAQDGPSNSRV